MYVTYMAVYLCIYYDTIAQLGELQTKKSLMIKKRSSNISLYMMMFCNSKVRNKTGIHDRAWYRKTDIQLIVLHIYVKCLPKSNKSLGFWSSDKDR